MKWKWFTGAVFLVGGVIFSFTNNLDIDFGTKYGRNSSETGISLMAESAFRS